MAEKQVGPFLRDRKASLSVEEALKILKTADIDKCTQRPPNEPSGGDIYVYKPKFKGNSDGWKEDGLQWRITSSVHLPRRSPVLLKRIYSLVPTDGKADKELKKEVYCEETDQEQNNLVLLHYLGNFEKLRKNSVPAKQSAVRETATDVASTVQEVEVVDKEDREQIQELSSTGEDSNLGPSAAAVSVTVSAASKMPSTNPESSGSTEVLENSGSQEEVTTKQAADSSTSPGELETAWKTLQTALGKKSGAAPVMKMVNKLLETVTGENAEETDYCLVVSDKKSGKSSVIGSPNITRRRSGRKRTAQETEAKEDEEAEDEAVSGEEQMEEFTNAVEHSAVKDIHSVTELGDQEVMTAAGEVIKMPKPKSENYFSFSIVSDEEKKIHSDFFDKRRAAKNPQRYLKIRNHIIGIWQQQRPRYVSISQARKGLKDCGDVTPMSRIHRYLECKGVINFNSVKSRPWMRKDKESSSGRPEAKRQKVGRDLPVSEEDEVPMDTSQDIDENVGKSKGGKGSSVKRGRPAKQKSQQIGKDLNQSADLETEDANVPKRKSGSDKVSDASEAAMKTPTKNSTDVNVGVRSSGRRTRNVSTPNWADIISGRKSFKKDGGVLAHIKKEPIDDDEEVSVDKGKEKHGQKQKSAKSKLLEEEKDDTSDKEVRKKRAKPKVEKRKEVQNESEMELEEEGNDESMDDSEPKEEHFQENLASTETEYISPNSGSSKNRISYKFSCTECDRKFCLGYLLEEHMKNVHSKSVDGVNTEVGTEIDSEVDEGEMDGDDDDDYADDVDDNEDEDDVDEHDIKPQIKKKDPIIMKKSTRKSSSIPKDSQKPKCDICGQVFLSVANMNRHSLLHTNKMYECPFCAKLMKRQDYVKQHIRKVHKDQDIEKNPIDFKKYTHIIEPEAEGSDGQNEIKREPADQENMDVKPSRARVVTGLGKKVCPECSKLFDTEGELEEHMILLHKKELKDAAYTCLACKKEFKTLVSYQVHKLSHRKKDHVCQHCGKKFVNNSQLQVHRRHDHQIQYGSLMYFGYLTNEGRLSCEICSQDFDSMEEFHEHRPVHLIYEYMCKKCGNGFTKEEDLKAHIDSECTQVNLHVACGVCDMKFSMYDTRRKHIVANHPRETDFFCHHCGISFEDLKSLTDHFPVHKEEKIFECEFCRKRFFEKRNLVDHRELHRSSKNWKCDICDRYYISSKSLQRHIKLHLNNAPKNCKYCDSKFKTNQELEEHLFDSHADKEADKYHTCKVCCRSFLEKSRLMKHMQVHDGNNTYTCDLCNESFDAAYLPQWKHLKRVHPEEAKKRSKRIFECDLCSFTTEHKQRLERHYETHRATKDFECEFCHKKYQTTSSLMTHMIVHRGKVKKGAKPEPICSWGNCNKQYVKHSLYKRHLISHIFKVKIGKDLCECGRCQYSAPQPGQPFFLQEDSDYSAVGFVDEDGNPLVATKLENPQEPANVLNVQLLSTGEQGYESMDVLQEAIAQIEDIENKGKKSEDNVDMEGKFQVDSAKDKNNVSSATKSQDNENEKKGDRETEVSSEYTVNNTQHPVTLPESSEAVENATQNYSQAVENTTQGMLPAGETIATPSVSQADKTQNVSQELVKGTRNATTVSNVSLIGYKYECGVCELMFQYKCHVLMHLEEEHPENGFPHCPTCGKVIIDKKNLGDHMYIHEETRGFKCDVCNKGFRTKQCLRQHSYVHAVTKPFTCNYCGHGFTQKGFYLEHIRRHTGVKPFKCSVCSKAFVSKNLLKIHMFSHANSRPYQCEMCPKSFSENYQLTAHMRTHNDDRPFECSECDKAFFVKPKLIRHLNTVHGINKDELTNYIATRVGDGIGYRDKTKLQKQVAASQKTQVVYIDTHGNIVSEELKDETEFNKEQAQDKVNRPIKARPNAPFIVMKNSDAATHVDTDEPQSFEVVTKRNQQGDVQVNAIMQGDINIPETVPVEQVAYQTPDGSLELNGENYTFVTQEGQGDGHVTLIAGDFDGMEANPGSGQDEGEIQVITHQEGVDGELVNAGENVQIVTQADLGDRIGEGENFSINIGEDGTVDAADYEKIEALRNMYSDQQIVIVLESQQQ